MPGGDFRPRIVGFLCNWCSYAGADLAGVSRFQYPPNLRVVRVMCSGRLDPVLIIETLLRGVDGVLVGGCHIGDCHYIDGNQYAQRKVWLTHAILERAGLEPARLRLEWVSAAEGQRFAEVVSDFTREVTDLGPSPLRGGAGGDGIRDHLEAARTVAGEFRLRTLISKEYKLTQQGNAYGELLPEDHVRERVLSAMDEEYVRSRIRKLTRGAPMSVKELSKETGVPTRAVLEHVVRLRQRNVLGLDSIDGATPRYRSLEGGD